MGEVFTSPVLDANWQIHKFLSLAWEKSFPFQRADATEGCGNHEALFTA